MHPFLLHHLLLESATRFPEQPAVVEPKRSVTYAELAESSARLAAALADAGVRPGEPVALWSEKTCSSIGAVYGISRRGAAYVPIDPAVPPARAAWSTARVGARAVVTTPSRVEIFYGLKRAGELPSLESLVVLGAADSLGPELRVLDATAPRPAVADARATGGYLAYVLHTSGSTGAPKGVAITHDNALAFVEPAADFFGIQPVDRLACQAPLHFDLSVFDLYCAASRGATVVSLPEYLTAFPKKMAQFVAQSGVTVWSSVVSALGLLVDKGLAPDARLETLRAVLFSGERMPIPLLRRVRDKAPNAVLYNVYGQTEANSSLVHRVSSIPDDDAASLPLGEPLPGFEVFLLDDEGQLLTTPGDVGELCVRAGTVASGAYFRAPELSRDKFVQDPVLPDTGATVYRTGDRVKRTTEGELLFAGRRDNMIKSRGYRVELSEIEVALEGVDGVVEVAVVAAPSAEIGHTLHAYVQTAPGSDLDGPRLEQALRDQLPAYMVPETIEVRAELPRTATGKIDRRALATERT